MKFGFILKFIFILLVFFLFSFIHFLFRLSLESVNASVMLSYCLLAFIIILVCGREAIKMNLRKADVIASLFHVFAFLAVLFMPFIPFIKSSHLAAVHYTALFSLIITIFYAALFEELAYRYIIYGIFRENGRILTGLIVSSLIFSLSHAGNPDINIFGFLNIFLFGALFNYIYIVHGDLGYPIMFHFFWNILNALFMPGYVSGLSTDKLIAYELGEEVPRVFSGGGFGIEGSALLTVLLAGYAFILVRKYGLAPLLPKGHTDPEEGSSEASSR